jgi:Na+-transporting NADH:ubiquinone oxidoreductase subunit NqrB
MVVFVRIAANVDRDASWIPADGARGLETELKDLISSSIKDCIDGLEITRIKVITDDDI